MIAELTPSEFLRNYADTYKWPDELTSALVLALLDDYVTPKTVCDFLDAIVVEMMQPIEPAKVTSLSPATEKKSHGHPTDLKTHIDRDLAWTHTQPLITIDANIRADGCVEMLIPLSSWQQLAALLACDTRLTDYQPDGIINGWRYEMPTGDRIAVALYNGALGPWLDAWVALPNHRFPDAMTPTAVPLRTISEPIEIPYPDHTTLRVVLVNEDDTPPWTEDD